MKKKMLALAVALMALNVAVTIHDVLAGSIGGSNRATPFSGDTSTTTQGYLNDPTHTTVRVRGGMTLMDNVGTNPVTLTSQNGALAVTSSGTTVTPISATGPLASGRVALSSTTTTVTDDAGFTFTGSGSTFLATISKLYANNSLHVENQLLMTDGGNIQTTANGTINFVSTAQGATYNNWDFLLPLSGTNGRIALKMEGTETRGVIQLGRGAATGARIENPYSLATLVAGGYSLGAYNYGTLRLGADQGITMESLDGTKTVTWTAGGTAASPTINVTAAGGLTVNGVSTTNPATALVAGRVALSTNGGLTDSSGFTFAPATGQLTLPAGASDPAFVIGGGSNPSIVMRPATFTPQQIGSFFTFTRVDGTGSRFMRWIFDLSGTTGEHGSLAFPIETGELTGPLMLGYDRFADSSVSAIHNPWTLTDLNTAGKNLHDYSSGMVPIADSDGVLIGDNGLTPSKCVTLTTPGSNTLNVTGTLTVNNAAGSAAIIADNRATASPIAIFKANTVAVVTVDANGNVATLNGTPTATFAQSTTTGTTITATTETEFDQTGTPVAGVLNHVGAHFRISISGIYTTPATPGTHTLGFRINSTTLATDGGVAPPALQVDAPWRCSIEGTVRTAGASGKVVCTVTTTYGAGVTAATTANGGTVGASATIDLTGSPVLKATFNNGNTSNKTTIQDINMQLTN